MTPEMQTELISALEDVASSSCSVLLLAGAGDAFCSGGDHRVRGTGGYVGTDGVPRLNVLDLHMRLRCFGSNARAGVCTRWKMGHARL